jgi:hypothetical protein
MLDKIIDSSNNNDKKNNKIEEENKIKLSHHICIQILYGKHYIFKIQNRQKFLAKKS